MGIGKFNSNGIIIIKKKKIAMNLKTVERRRSQQKRHLSDIAELEWVKIHHVLLINPIQLNPCPFCAPNPMRAFSPIRSSVDISSAAHLLTFPRFDSSSSSPPQFIVHNRIISWIPKPWHFSSWHHHDDLVHFLSSPLFLLFNFRVAPWIWFWVMKFSWIEQRIARIHYGFMKFAWIRPKFPAKLASLIYFPAN